MNNQINNQISNQISNETILALVNEMKMKENKEKNIIFEKINEQATLTGKCVIARYLISPQSTYMETIVKEDLKISKSVNETSGDGCKNGINYEIKVSLHAKNSKFNFVQIRPDHSIDFYILIGYNMYDETCSVGKAYILKIPSNDMYNLVVEYGGYAHGTCEKLGNITINNIKGRNCEYALRCDPNNKNGKNYELWKKLMNYEVSYNDENF